jgi:hypothetical protein
LGRRRAAAGLIDASRASIPGRALLAVQRLVLRTQAGPLRPLWMLWYAVTVRALVAAVRRGNSAITVYVKGSLGERGAVYGLSDIDFSIVTPADPGAPGAASTRLRERARRVARQLPGRLDELLYSHVYEPEDIGGLGSEPVFVYGLDSDSRDTPPKGLYFDSRSESRGSVPTNFRAIWDRVYLHERPGVYGPMTDWRLVAGPERRPPHRAWDAHRRRMAAWLELQFWWRRTVTLAVRPDAMGAAYMAVKLVAEPARIWLWLTEGERCESRVDALRRARERLPSEAEAFEEALDLHRRLSRRPAVDVPRTLATLTRLSALIAERFAHDLDAMGRTPVSLLGAGQRDLMLAQGKWRGPLPASAPKPLADWRALVWPRFPDESFVTLSGSPADPAKVAACAEAEQGPYPTLIADGLLVRPTVGVGRGHLRALQCRISDPVSFALLDGTEVAHFPCAPGWSARDWARRATAEHAAWLAWAGGSLETSGPVLAMLISAVRAALFLESVEVGEPQLPLTIAATLEALAVKSESQREVAESAAEGYADFAALGRAPSVPAVRGLERVVRRLTPYDLGARGLRSTN